MKLRLACAALAVAVIGVPAQAADDLPETYSFTANLGGPTPMPAGTFSFIPNTPLTSPILTSIDFRLGNTIFTLENTRIAADNEAGIFVLGALNSPFSVAPGTDDFQLSFRRDTRAPVGFRYSQAGSTSVFSTGFASNNVIAANVQLVGTAAGVPEPGTWAMMLLGFGAVGCAMRWRKPKVACATV